MIRVGMLTVDKRPATTPCSWARACSTLNQIREAHKAAVKELGAENKKALDAKRKTNTSSKPVAKPDDKGSVANGIRGLVG